MSNIKSISHSRHSHAKSVAVIGGGPTALYFLKHVVENGMHEVALTFFSTSETIGAGMPYSRAWVGTETLANIACEEIPDLETPPHDWLLSQSDNWLQENNINRLMIGPGFIPARYLLGQYFEEQFETLLSRAVNMGITVNCQRQVTVTDLLPTETGMTVVYRHPDGEEKIPFDYVIMATGHLWPDEDTSQPRLLASPWPISKLDAVDGHHIGLIGTSLSAIDTCLALARKNGVFARDFDGRLKYVASSDTPDLRIVMHSRRGLLPPVRVHFEYPRFEMYSYISQADMEDHIRQNGGHLALEFLFEHILKTVLKEKSPEAYSVISAMNFEAFVDFIQQRRKAKDPFTSLREEYEISVASVRDRTPIYWKEVLDDIAYTLNFHVRRLEPADVLRVHNQFMPLLTHLIAVLPQQTCEQILALHDADCLRVAGIGDNVAVVSGIDQAHADIVFNDLETNQRVSLSYDFVVDCRGQKPVDVEDFPFTTLVDAGLITAAKVSLPQTTDGPDDALLIGGIDVDDLLRPVSKAGTSSKSLFILSAPLIHGMYPYHSGLPFCNEVAKKVADELLLVMRGRSLDIRLDKRS